MRENAPQNQRIEVNARAGIPGWITPDLIQDTLDTWQPYSENLLTEGDAVEILRNVGLIVDTLGELA